MAEQVLRPAITAVQNTADTRQRMVELYKYFANLRRQDTRPAARLCIDKRKPDTRRTST